MKKIIIISATLLLLATAAFAQKTSGPEEPKKAESAALLSNWDIVISAPGQELAGTLKLAKDAEAKIKGSVITEFGESPVANVVINGDAFTGNITVSVQGSAYDGTITGTVKDGKLTGEISLSGLGAFAYSGAAKKP